MLILSRKTADFPAGILAGELGNIENYAKTLKNEEPEKYEKIFSGYLKKNKINPLKISQLFTDTRKTIESKA